jgi:hypothetical protein
MQIVACRRPASALTDSAIETGLFVDFNDV